MTRDRARKAAVHQHAQDTGESYTRAGRTLAGTDSPPAPVTVWIEVDDFHGPRWGGYLHSHGSSVAITARADGGAGCWLGPDDLPGGVPVLEDALHLLPDPDGGYYLDLKRLHAAVSSQLPGCDIAIVEDDGMDDDPDDPSNDEFDELQQQVQDEHGQAVVLLHREVTWDCEQPACA